MDYVLETLHEMTNEEAREYISLLFSGYMTRKKEHRLFKESDIIPKLIILNYYAFVKKPSFDQIVYNFKRRYIYNENKVESVHSHDEQKGLACVYDYILKKDNLSDISIYDLSYIHEELYSKTAYPEFGGKYRNEDIYLLSGNNNTGNIELTPYWNITHEMNELKPEVEEIINEGLSLAKNTRPDLLMQYIDRCIELKCKLIKIHPFRDGNGRSVRGFINLLFRIANVPPIYIRNKEKKKYQEAMNKALLLEDYKYIKTFYYYKICDSIIDLDLEINIENKNNKYTSKISSDTMGNSRRL
jgi:fido (protein-threonine AMPylation protein)